MFSKEELIIKILTFINSDITKKGFYAYLIANELTPFLNKNNENVMC
jgi:hypothetical protein